MMLTAYWLCFGIGGAFVLLAVLSGFDGIDFGDPDADIHLDIDLELVDTGDRPSSVLTRQRARYSFLDVLKSFKFWTFGLCFFGLTGLVLSNLSTPLALTVITVISILMGISCGAIMAGSLRALQRQKSDSLVRTDDLVGLTGTVQLPFDKESRGKVRLQVKGSLIDSIAYTTDGIPLRLGDRVLVVGMERDRLWVVSANSLNGES